MKYMMAHGSSPGPTHRPWLTGAISGGVAVVIPVWVLNKSGAISMLAKNLNVSLLGLAVCVVAVAVIAGGIYSRVFGRAVNDRSGGWLYGISFGFLVWVLGPTVLLQWIRQQPLVVGSAASGTFVAHLLWGLLLGFLVPYVHRIIARRSIPHVSEIIYGHRGLRKQQPAENAPK